MAKKALSSAALGLAPLGMAAAVDAVQAGLPGAPAKALRKPKDRAEPSTVLS